jgi:hypothetical protein
LARIYSRLINRLSRSRPIQAFRRFHVLEVLVPQLRHEMRLASFGKDRTVLVDSAEGLFRRDGETVALFSIKPATVRLHPTLLNPDRVVLYRSPGRNGLCLFYYKTDVERLFIANGDSIIRIQRDDISAVRKAFRKFTRTARPDLTKKPGKEFKDYPPPLQ